MTKAHLLPCVIWLIVGAAFAAEIAPASAQYHSEGRKPVSELERLRIEAKAAAARLAEAERAEAEKLAAERRKAEAEAAVFSPRPTAPRPLPRRVWEKVELADGRNFERARVTAEEAATVTFIHAGGVAKVDKRLLPEDLAELFPYDVAGAQAAKNETALRRARLASEQKREADAARVRAKSGRGVSFVTRDSSAPADIEFAVRQRAHRYFENVKRTGSGATLVFGIQLEMEEPTAVTNWADRWEVQGVASYKVYDSVGWGSFSSRTKKFRAFVEAPAGQKAKVVDFEER